MQAIGDYHSHTPVLNQAYRLQVLSAATTLFAGRAPQAVRGDQPSQSVSSSNASGST